MATPTTVYISPQQRKGLFQRARRRRSSFSQELREAIDLYLDLPADFDKESLAALAKEANASLDRSIARLDEAISYSRISAERIDEFKRREGHLRRPEEDHHDRRPYLTVSRIR
jgi:hypothetical protein